MKYLSVASAMILVCIFICICAFAQGQESYEDYIRSIEDKWDEYSEAKEYEKFLQEQDAAFQEFVLKEQEEYDKFVKEVENKWSVFTDSSP